MTLTASIAERIGAVPKRALVVGGHPAFLTQTLAPKLAAWGLRVDWHWPTGKEPMAGITLPAGCEVVIYFSDMAAKPGAIGPALRAAAEARPEVKLIRTVRKSSIWAQDFSRAGLTQDTNYHLKEPPMPPIPESPKKSPALILPAPAEVAARGPREVVGELIALLGELDAMLAKAPSAAALADAERRWLEATKRAEAAEEKLKALDALKALLSK